MKILIVEDDRTLSSTMYYYITHFLKSDCVVASNLNQGLSEVASFKPDIVLLDNLLESSLAAHIIPDMRRVHGNDVKIYLMSGWPNIEKYAEKYKADGVLSKPFDLVDLNKIIS